MAQDGDERQAVPKTLRELKEEKANYEAQQNYWFDSLTLTKKEEKLLIKIQKALNQVEAEIERREAEPKTEPKSAGPSGH